MIHMNDNIHDREEPIPNETAFQTLCNLIGKPLAVKFCRVFVSQRKVRISEGKFFSFREVIGAKAAKKIIDTFGGELLTLPECREDPATREERDSAILAAAGRLPQVQIAKLAGISRQQVYNIQARRGAAGKRKS